MIHNRITKIFSVLIVTLVMMSNAVYALNVAITVDDVPANGTLPPGETRTAIAKKMLAVFKKHHIKGVYGLINGEKLEGNDDGNKILAEWINQKQLLGNHTYSHLDFAKTSATDYIDNIKKNELILSHAMGSNNFRYFRYPYLSEGSTQESRDAVRKYLADNGYKIAPVTVDFFEYQWNEPYVRCMKKHDKKAIQWLKKTYIEQALNALTISHELSKMLFDRDINNVLLIHINAFTTEMLDDLLTAYEDRNVNFISLPDALNDTVYKINPNVVKDRAYTFLNQVRLSRGLDNPAIVTKLYRSLPEKELDGLCR